MFSSLIMGMFHIIAILFFFDKSIFRKNQTKRTESFFIRDFYQSFQKRFLTNLKNSLIIYCEYTTFAKAGNKSKRSSISVYKAYGDASA
jgi:hypothetical protein